MGGSCTFLAFFVLGPRLPSGAGGRTGGPPPTAAKWFTGLRQLCCATRSLSRSPRRRRTGSPLPGSHLTSSDSARIWGRCFRPPHPPGLASHGVHASMASLLRPPLRTFALKSSPPSSLPSRICRFESRPPALKRIERHATVPQATLKRGLNHTYVPQNPFRAL